ncbi:MAG: type II toxin-antitoxin system RelE/ParE family toxin [Saprospiraceae bacterium]
MNNEQWTNHTVNINILIIPKPNHFKNLKDQFSDLYSIRINNQCRILFNWQNNNAENIQISDYHE